MIAAIYTRISPNPKKKDTINQERELLEYCQKWQWQVYKIYTDIHISGAKRGSDRPQFAEMMLEASKRKFDVVLFWSLDRFSREGTYETMTYLRALSGYGVGFKSYSDPILDTTNEMIRDIVITVMSALAKQERVRISERTRVGVETARLKGKILGRPRVKVDYRDIVASRLDGMSLPRIAAKFGISLSTVERILRGVPVQV